MQNHSCQSEGEGLAKLSSKANRDQFKAGEVSLLEPTASRYSPEKQRVTMHRNLMHGLRMANVNRLSWSPPVMALTM